MGRFFLPVLLLLSAAAPGDIPVDDILRATPALGGVAVVVGSDTSLAERLAGRGPWIVHLLAAEEAAVEAARGRIVRAGVAGQVTAEAWKAATLPYPGNLVNLLVAEETRGILESEILRALAPGGTAWFKRDGAWSSVRKPKAEGHDEWTHWRHGADGNMVSGDREAAVPTGLRWVAGPAQDAGGRRWYYDHILVSSNGRNFYVFDDLLLARDSHNGALLWSRPIKPHAFRETGTPLPADAPPSPKMKLGTRVSRVRPVASGDTLYVATGGQLLALDGRTGEPSATLGELKDPRELLVDGGLILAADAKAVLAWHRESGRPAWESPVEARRMVAGDGGVFAVTATHVVGLDRGTGKELWRVADAEAPRVLTCTYRNGLLVLEKSTLRDDGAGCGIKVYDTKLGELAWTRDYKPDMTHYREARAYFAQGLLWIQLEKDKLVGLDPKSGSERKEWKSRGKHCATPVATERFFMAPECEFTDFQTGQQTRTRIFKSACRLPFIPANGLLYTFPVQCECFPMLRGYMALASEPPPALAAGPRRSDGTPARGEAPKTLLRPDEGADWPTYRHDVYRSAGTPAALKRSDVRLAWETPVAAVSKGPLAPEWKANPFVRGPVTPLVAAGGRIFVAAPDLHRLAALDARSGAPLWTFTAGGRIDGPPTVHDGLCLFGSHDGWIYAVRAEDGTLAWRLRAAPREARLPAYGQIESPWPVVANVLVDRGTAYAAAGRHPAADGGVRVLAFRPKTGDVVWEKTVEGIDEITKWYGGTLPNSPTGPNKMKIGLDFEPVDLLVRDGDSVAMSRWKFAPADGAFAMAMASLDYSGPGGLSVPRGLWGYGIRQTKLVTPKPPAAFDGAGIRKGLAGDVALILAGGIVVAANAKGELRVGEAASTLPSEPVPDGLIAAYGRLYVATAKGTVLCLE